MIKNLRLNITITIAILIGILIPVSISTWYTLNNQQKYFDEQIKQKIDTINLINTQVVWYMSKSWAQIMVDSFFVDKSIVEITISDDEGKIFFSKRKDDRAIGKLITINKPLKNYNQNIGKIKIVLNRIEIEEQIQKDKKNTLLVAFFQVFLALILLMPLMYYKVLLPIKRLNSQSKKLANNELDKPFIWNRNDELGTLGKGLEFARVEIQKLFLQLQDMAHKDPMTNLYNRRFFTEVSVKILKTLIKENKPLTIMIIDIDKFKNINDTLGHTTGDSVIIDLANTLNNSLRKSDIIARFGGEEFVVLLQDTNLKDTNNIAEKLRKTIQARKVTAENNSIVKYTVSIGISEFIDDNDKSIECAIERADKGLYQAKENGRNQVCIFSQD